MKVYLHAGLPRTATRCFVKIFPKLDTIHYLGKNADNSVLNETFRARQLVQELCARYRRQDTSAIEELRKVLLAVLHALLGQNRDKASQALQTAGLFAWCLHQCATSLQDKPCLFSEEALTESVSGLTGQPSFGDAVPLEQLHKVGFLAHASLSVVLRDPSEFLTASYYKAMEIMQNMRAAPASFDEYIRQQLAIGERHPSASRIFLARHAQRRLISGPCVLRLFLCTTSDWLPRPMLSIPFLARPRASPQFRWPRCRARTPLGAGWIPTRSSSELKGYPRASRSSKTCRHFPNPPSLLTRPPIYQ